MILATRPATFRRTYGLGQVQVPVAGAAALHVLGDALGSVGVIAAAVVLLTTGWPYADTVASLLIMLLIAPRAFALLREAAHVLLEGVPRGVDVTEVKDALAGTPGVVEVHDLHVWAINDRTPAASAHLVVDSGGDEVRPATGCGEESVLDRAATILRERFGVDHSTLQLEHRAHSAHEHRCS